MIGGEMRWPARVDGERASLVAVRTDAIEADWLAEAGQAVAGRGVPCPLQGRLDEGDTAYWIRAGVESSRMVGALSGQLVDLEDVTVLVWTWLAVAAEWRHYGYGGASVPLFERAASECGAASALVPLPPDNGVALYFWLRLGYVPQRESGLEQSNLPTGVAPSALWMRRSLSNADGR